ncbi:MULTISPECIES: FeoA family protein [unclassified Virgibacillus]|uniref:FeoA family protein n=1 Tax=unclassified Virgibacillus TaxID=2620237 RepID=UPI0024DE91DA|nr:FeoA family protein [Virgibacillus sp. LDC-1]
MNLSELRSGQYAIIDKMESIDSALQLRLTSVGLLPGCKLCMKQSSLLNGPCILECRGQNICIRKAEAKKIEVIQL